MKGFLCGIAFLATVLCLAGCEARVDFVSDKAQDYTIGGRILSADWETDIGDMSHSYLAVGFLHDDGAISRFAICNDNHPPLQKGMHVVWTMRGEAGVGCYKSEKLQLIEPFDFNKPEEKK